MAVAGYHVTKRDTPGWRYARSWPRTEPWGTPVSMVAVRIDIQGWAARNNKRVWKSVGVLCRIGLSNLGPPTPRGVRVIHHFSYAQFGSLICYKIQLPVEIVSSRQMEKKPENMWSCEWTHPFWWSSSKTRTESTSTSATVIPSPKVKTKVYRVTGYLY